MDLLCYCAHTSSPAVTSSTYMTASWTNPSPPPTPPVVYEQLQTVAPDGPTRSDKPAQAVEDIEIVEEPCFHQREQGAISLPVSGRAENKGLPLLQPGTQGQISDKVRANMALKHSYRGERGYRSLRMTRSDLITENASHLSS